MKVSLNDSRFLTKTQGNVEVSTKNSGTKFNKKVRCFFLLKAIADFIQVTKNMNMPNTQVIGSVSKKN